MEIYRSPLIYRIDLYILYILLYILYNRIDLFSYRFVSFIYAFSQFIHWTKCHLQKNNSFTYQLCFIFILSKVTLTSLLPYSWQTVNDHTQCANITGILIFFWLVVIVQSHSHRWTQIITDATSISVHRDIYLNDNGNLSKGRLAHKSDLWNTFLTSASCIHNTAGSFQDKLLSSNLFKCNTSMFKKSTLFNALQYTIFNCVL